MSTHADKTAAERLATPVQFLKGVGPQRADLMRRLDLETARDVLFLFPRDYEDLSDLRTVDELEEDALVSVRGTVEEIDSRDTGEGRSIVGVLIRQGPGYLRALWFNQPHMRQRFRRGQEVLLSGKAKLNGGRWEMAHPHVRDLDSTGDEPEMKMLPVYPLTEGLKQFHLRKIVREALDAYVPSLEEVFPREFLAAHDLAPIHEALPQIHFPRDAASLARARRRLVYQELLVLQLALAIKRQQMQTQCRAPRLEATAKINARIERLWPFELTPGQRQAIVEVAADVGREVPMNRLLQGEVGSGKTIVAVYAMLLAVAHGYQAALMAPTEVLARQHEQTLGEFLHASRVRTVLLTGSLTGSKRDSVLADVAAGKIDVVIGTQAIVLSGVRFAKLGLVVIDEQHKFGVRQRAELRGAGLDPHYLVMTATPIPRTVAMTLFGDLDVSVLRDGPPGRQRVHTYIATESERSQWWEFFRGKLREGRQGYVIAPLVAGGEEGELASAEAAFETLANGELEAFRLGMIHGRMTPAEKEAAMRHFREGRTQVLVATSVVEVGVDVPGATLMTIEGPERFGLAQLHQLRGRISRGAYPGYCCVFADPATVEAQQRLAAFAESTDGFHLAEVDFLIRGPGELLGTRQHGLPPLRIADLNRDGELLEEARDDARRLVEVHPGLAGDAWSRLRRMVLVRYGQALALGDVG